MDENEISIFVIELLLITNVTLLLIDQIHFQYNGFLFGILLVSISHILKVKNNLYIIFVISIRNFNNCIAISRVNIIEVHFGLQYY